MNYTRIFLEEDFSYGDNFNLSVHSSQHLKRVLRKKKGDLIKLFNGRGLSCIAEIASKERNRLRVKIVEDQVFNPKDGVNILMGLSLIKNDPFSFSIQKATELGVTRISPLITERVVIKTRNSSNKIKYSRWKSIAIGACEQCGENWLPEIEKIQSLNSWSENLDVKHKIVLYPNAEIKISELSFEGSVAIAVGPEGDFSEKEISLLKDQDFIPVTVGSRVLRAETAVVSSLSAIRTICGEI